MAEQSYPVTVEAAAEAFEFIRLKLINCLDEPQRSAFWKAVEMRDLLRARSSDGGVEVRHAKTGNMPVSQAGEETCPTASSLARSAVRGAAIQPCAGVTTGPSEPITHRWRSFGAHTWIYDPEPEWLEDHKFEVEWEPVYGAPQPASVAQASASPEVERIDDLEKTLWLFREFVSRNATQWAMGAGSHHHPMWALVAKALGDSVGYMTDTLKGSEWRFVQPDNREPLSPVSSTHQQSPQTRDDILRGLAEFFSQSVHHVWDSGEITDCLTNMIGSTSPVSSTDRAGGAA